MKCPRCGAEILDDDRLCPTCRYRPDRENGQKKSKIGAIVMALLVFLLYIGIMMGCQIMISYFCSLKTQGKEFLKIF